jgi:hypothetical protein
MSILLKVAAICFVLTVTNWVLTEIMANSMTDSEKANYIFNNIVPKRLMFFTICLCISFAAMFISLIFGLIMM